MIHTVLLFCLLMIFLIDASAAFYFFKRSESEEKIIEQLKENYIKSFGEVIDKKRIKRPNSKLWKEYIIIQYGGNSNHLDQSSKGLFSTQETNNPKKYYVHEYQVHSLEYMNTNIGQKVEIKYSPKKPEIVKVLNSDGTTRKMQYNLLSKVLFGLSLIPLYLFLELLITGDSILKIFIEF